MYRVSRLQLRSMHRAGGGSKHERFTHDFVVDGLSLADALGGGRFDLVGCLDVMNREGNTRAAKALLLDGPADVPPDRVMLYVCPECGDLGCGAFTARVTKTAADEYVWSDFRYENNYDPEMTHPRDDLGPFRFARTDYRVALYGVAEIGWP